MVCRAAVAGLSLVAVLACVAWGVVRWQRGEGELAARLLEVKPGPDSPPDFELPAWDGDRWSLSSAGNKVVMVNFWATWCPPCIEEMPSLTRFVERFRDHPDFEFVAVSADDSWEPVRSFWGEEPPFRVVLDREGELAARWGTRKFPETFVVRDGRVLGYVVGPRDWDTWYAAKWVESMLGDG
jgi:thiol-disulfide isomerase/thioredoxin